MYKNLSMILISFILFVDVVFFFPLNVLADSGNNITDGNISDEIIETAMDNAMKDVNLGLTSKAALIMEKTTGTIIYSKNSDERLGIASITKIMTLILIYDAINEKKIALEDIVITSAYAKSMGGSQVFLEEGEEQTVETLIKCIVIASGNDASVAMAEHISGSELEFVKKMNERAKGLGMENTNFEDCCGLTDSTNHYSSAKDIAIMAQELITLYPKILEYSQIWMETIIHNTRQGSSEFVLSNTNKLIKQYKYCTGLKTGSTQAAKYCLCATANKDGIELIAVVLAANDHKIRFNEAKKMLDYGYANCKLYKSEEKLKEDKAKIYGGISEYIDIEVENFQYLSTNGENVDNIVFCDNIYTINAPVKSGDIVGERVFYLDDLVIGKANILAKQSIKKANVFDWMAKLISYMLF